MERTSGSGAAAIAKGYHQVSSNYRLPLIVASIKSLMTGSRLRSDLEEPIASVMGIGSEVCGRCVEEIDVSVEVEYEGG